MGKLYSCQPIIINSEHNKVLEDVGGNHLTGETNLDVQGLNVTNQTAKRFPMNLDKFYPNLTAIEWRKTSLTVLNADDLIPFSNLLILNVAENNLLSLDSDLLRFTQKLEWIDFSANLIEHVGHDLLNYLSELHHADFQDNSCINIIADTPEEIRKLKVQLTDCAPVKVSERSTSDKTVECSQQCIGRLETLEDKVFEQSEIISELRHSYQTSVARMLGLERKLDLLEAKFNAKY